MSIDKTGLVEKDERSAKASLCRPWSPNCRKESGLNQPAVQVMHPTGNLFAMTAREDDLDSSADEGENPQQSHTNAQQYPSEQNAASALDVTAIHAIIHEELAAQGSSQQFYNQSAVQPPILDPVPFRLLQSR